uniref:SLC12A transporter C-terminal domain-containing protein n=1 Tax=Chrysotila carterae TaxID=13221 RepID=A0A6T0A713_CHRCT
MIPTAQSSSLEPLNVVLSAYLPTHLPIYLPACLLTYFAASLPRCLGLPLRHSDASTFLSTPSAQRAPETIDIWWVSHDGALPLTIAHLLTIHEALSHCAIRVFMWIEQREAAAIGSDVASIETRVRHFLRIFRLRAKHVEVVSLARTPLGETAEARALHKEAQLNEAMVSRTTASTLLLITNLTAPSALHLAQPLTYGDVLEAACAGLPPVLFVCDGAGELHYVD